MAPVRHARVAFTLVELLAVIVIMGILAALLIMAAKGAREKSAVEAARAGVSFISTQMDAFRNKRGEFSIVELHGDTVATEDEIYRSLEQYGFAVPPEKQLDPWGNPYIIVLQRDYGKSFPIDGSAAPYNVLPWNKMPLMYTGGAADPPPPAGPSPKEVHSGDPATTAAYLNQTDEYQVICAGPDGLLSRDNGEERTDVDGDTLTVNADNLTNW